MKIWIDITNSSQVNFFRPIINHLKSSHEIIITTREFSETVGMIKSFHDNPIVVGEHHGKKIINKVIGGLQRVYYLNKLVPEYDLSFSIGAFNTSFIGKIRKKKSIIFSDNDIVYKGHPAYKMGSYFIFPKFYNTSNLENKYRIAKESIYKYNGYKEDIYIADYKVDNKFLSQLPFDNFITIRPENLKASYVPNNSVTIVPKLLDKFKHEKILFLPRYKEEKEFARGYNNIFIPESPLSGLDISFFTKAMLTGAGTFAREAALLGTPAVSFYPGETFLSVDKNMQKEGLQYKSRDIDDIYKYVMSSKKRHNQIKNSKIVKKEVIEIIEKIMKRI